MIEEKNVAFLSLRLYAGCIFAYHGIRKLTVDYNSWIEFTKNKDIHKLLATSAGILELSIGIALILGYYTRFASILGILFMISALVIAHSKDTLLQISYQISIIMCLFAITLTGSGAYAIHPDKN